MLSKPITTLSSNISFFLLFIYFLLYPPFGKWRWSRVWIQNITLKFLIQEVKEEERNIVLKYFYNKKY